MSILQSIIRATYDTNPPWGVFNPTGADGREAVTTAGSLFPAMEEGGGIAFSRLLASVEDIYPLPVTDWYRCIRFKLDYISAPQSVLWLLQLSGKGL